MTELKPDTYYKLTDDKIETFFKVTKEALESDTYTKLGNLECKDVIIKDTRRCYTDSITYIYNQVLFIMRPELLNVETEASVLKKISYKDYLQELMALKTELDYNYEELIRQSFKDILDKGGEK